ncbi:MAG: hypothetical protein NUV84_01020, partial [Candidatus Uhrbacteria bacterium]|nr:hypothetical protein [Candidatus Uhrbacteria bacterium]
ALMGETGSGKTALAHAAAIILSSRDSERDVGGATGKFEKLLATVGGIKDGETYYKYGALLRAMTGKSSSIDTNPSVGGGIFFDDEFNTRPTSVQRQILKFVSEARAGRKVSVPGTTISVTIAPGFLYLAAGNPSSERYDREETGIETKREFAGNVLNVEYLEQTAQNPELYQVLLAALMDRATGRLTAVTPGEIAPEWKEADAITGESHLDTDPTAGAFLWRFSNAWRELFKAFSQQDTALNVKNPSQPKSTYHLSTFILDPGIVLTWMDRYKASPKDRKGHLATFVLDQFAKYLSQFPQDEQKIVEAYLNHFGIALSAPSDKSAKDKQLLAIHKKESIKPTARVLTPKELGYLNPNVPRPIDKHDRPPTDAISPLLDADGNEIGKHVRVSVLGIEPNTELKRRGDVTDADVPQLVTFLGVGYDEASNKMDRTRILVRADDGTIKQYDLETFKTYFVVELLPPPPAPEMGELAPFAYDRKKAKEYGFSELAIEAHRPAQQIIDAIYARDSRFVTLHKTGSPDPDSTTTPPAILTADKYKLNQAALKAEWNKNCPDLPNVPEKSLWYFKALADYRLSNTIDGDDPNNLTNPALPHIPGFGQRSFMLAMDFNEFDWDNAADKQAAITPQTKAILRKLFNTEDPTNLKRDGVNTALWSDHENRVPSTKAKEIIEEFLGAGENSDDFELRLLRYDEYARAASAQGFGQKNLWTYFDGYYAHDDGHRSGLHGGYRVLGGAARAGHGHREARHDGLAVRLVLSRKSPEAPFRSEIVKLQEARDILGADNVFGPEAVKATWDRDLASHEIPPLPYSHEQLEGAKRMNMMLVLRIDHDATGQPLTGERMNEIIEPKLQAPGKGKLLYKVDWYPNEAFYKTATPKPEWKLVTRDLLPNSTNLDYADQTRLLRDTLASQPDLTPQEQAAIAQADDATLDRLKALSQAVATWKQAATELAALSLNRNHRRSFADTIFDHASLLQTHNVRLFNGQTVYDWTNDRASDGNLVDAGRPDSDGLHVGGWSPGDRDGYLGVSLSR